jgi:HAD superfamily hydrolase (TIGR01458 family)
VRAAVLDMEGVLHTDWQPLAGAAEAVRRLRAGGLELAILTNTTGRTRGEIAERLAGMGIEFPAERIVTAAHATALHVAHEHPGAAVFLLGEQGAAAEFDAGTRMVERPSDADLIVISGPTAELAYPALNEVFRALLEGCRLVAMQRNPWWPTSSGPAMDAGGVAGLEYAAGVTAQVVGKPSATIYRIALQAVGAEPAHAVMVGDDLQSDLEPAAQLGMRTCLVRTGKGASMRPNAGQVSYDEPDLAAFAASLLS